jgi:immune inhibitor A
LNSFTRRFLTGSTALAVCATMGATVSVTSATASPDRKDDAGRSAAHRSDNRPGPLTKRQDALRDKALAMLANGSADLQRRQGGGATVALGAKKPGADAAPAAFEFPVNRTDRIFTVLSEFSDVSHNSIPQPDRAQDNSTVWREDFDAAYYDNLFNGPTESMTDYYRKVSSGKYSVSSTVEDWVAVPGSLASYGANDVEDDGGSWQFIADTVDAWYADQLASGKSVAEVKSYLASLDVWDRYDANNNGNFNEPDGYIDHFQAVHAGEGEEAGASPDAIWSHRWYVNGTDYGQTGPGQNKLGGTEIGDSGFWIGDYTVEPENGGLGVFAHEYAHDLGLPDYYDTAGGENGTSFWTLMSSGSWLGNGEAAGEGIGTTPGLMGPEEKLELGWLDYTEVDGGESGTFNLGPSQNTYDDPRTTANEADQAVKVNLPDLTTTTAYTTPPEGSNAWWTGRGDGLNNTLARQVEGSGSVTVTASAWYEIEAGYDYLYAEISTDGGANWTQVGSPVDGSSGNRWKTLRYSYTSPGTHQFRFRYSTDGGVNEAGAFLDNIAIKSSAGTVTDGAESGANGWTSTGWKISTGSETVTTPRYYLIENRQHVGYDSTLGTGPYNFSKGLTKPNWVEFFQFRPGMVVWYVNDAYADNNVATHPGGGAAMPVDARPAPFSYSDGTRPSNRRQPFDAAFGTTAVPETCLHKEVLVGKGKNQTVQELAACAPANAGIPTFDDSDPLRYWSSANPQNSVKVAGVGVKATVTGGTGGFLTVSVTNPAG